MLYLLFLHPCSMLIVLLFCVETRSSEVSKKLARAAGGILQRCMLAYAMSDTEALHISSPVFGTGFTETCSGLGGLGF